MHETSIALSILAAVEDAYESTPGAKKVTRIRIRVGMLSLIDLESLKFALRIASRETPAENAIIEFQIEKPVFRCKKCGYQWEMKEKDLNKLVKDKGLEEALHFYPDLVISYLECPRCGSREVEIEKGRGVIVESVEIETEEYSDRRG